MQKRTHKRSLTLSGHRTSISLEEPFWQALNDISKEKDQTVTQIVSKIDRDRINDDIGLSSAIRIYILEYYRNKFIE